MKVISVNNKSFIFNVIYLALGIIFVIPALFTPDRTVGDSFVVATAIIAGGIGSVLLSKGKLLENKWKGKELAVLLIGTGLFLILFSLESLIRSENYDREGFLLFFGNRKGKVIYWYFRSMIVPLLGISGMILADRVSLLFRKNSEIICSIDEFRKIRNRYLVFTALFGLLFCIANYPFRTTGDAVQLWASVYNRNYNDWYAIGFYLYVKFCTKFLFFIGKPFAVTLVNLALLTGVIYYGFNTIYQISPGRKGIILYGSLNLIFYQLLMYLGSVIHDTVFTICVTGMTLALFRIVYLEERKKKDVTVAVLFGCGVAVFRHMGVAAATAALIAGLLYAAGRGWKKKAAAVSLAVIPLCFFLLLNLFGNKILSMEKNPEFIKFSVPMYISAAFASHEPEVLEAEDRELLEELMPMEDWVAGYESDPYWVDTVSRIWGTPGERIYQVDNRYGWKIIRLNIKLLLRRPFSYMEYLMDSNSELWEIAMPRDGEVWVGTEFYSDEDRPELTDQSLNSENLTFFEPTVWNMTTVFLNALEYLTYNSVVLKTVFFRGGIWVFLLLVTLVRAFFRKQVKLIIPCTGVIVIDCLLIISCMAQDFRFMLPTMEVGLFLIVWNLIGFSGMNKNEITEERGT